MSRDVYDAIVVGVGGMGAAACFELARRGVRVLGVEQFDLGHDRGSSHGLTRVIRKAYYEHPAYVPLVTRAYEHWYDLEQIVGQRLLTECSCLNIGTKSSNLVQGVLGSARDHGLAIEELTAGAIAHRFPPFRLPDDFVGILEQNAGILHVENCVAAHIDAARHFGTDIRSREPVVGWNAERDAVDVQTVHGHYRARRLILTAGPWMGSMLQQRGQPLRVMRQTLLWLGTTNDSAFRRDRFPIYLADVPDGYFYGLPVIDSLGHKVAQHYGAMELSSPDQIDRVPNASDELPVRSFLNQYLPAANGPLRRAQVCTYTLTPDRHFIVDRHPDHENVVIAAGFSGHGFKFAPVIGEILADLALDGRTPLPIDLFRLSRFDS